MAKRKRHPVWDVYDEYRTTLYQVKAHTHKIHRLRKLSRWMDIALAVFTPSSAVAGIFFWNTQAGKIVWNILILSASVLAISKPFLQFDKQIKALISSLAGYMQLLHELEDLKTNIRLEDGFNDKLRRNFESTRKKKLKVYRNTALFELSRKEQYKLFNEVLREAPTNRFFVPEDAYALATDRPAPNKSPSVTNAGEIPSA
jgi:hypothetical protein